MGRFVLDTNIAAKIHIKVKFKISEMIFMGLKNLPWGKVYLIFFINLNCKEFYLTSGRAEARPARVRSKSVFIFPELFAVSHSR